MGLFKKSQDFEEEKKGIKKKIEKLMSDYDKEKIDGDTYFKKRMNLTSSYKDKNEK